MKNEQKMGNALVIGGGMAGLLAARVLSDFFAEVLIVEKDDFPEQPANRPGTPQAFHPHRFTSRGKSITERLFPDYEADLLALGAPSSLNKTAYNMNQYGSMEGLYPRNDIKFSRAVLEWVIRKRVQRMANVRFFSKHDVIGLTRNADQTAVTGVQVREVEGSGLQILTAELVVDTSGRNSKLSKWLTDMGYEVPKPDLLKVDLGYSTRRYKLPDHLSHLTDQWDVINIAGQPANGTYTGVFSFIENQVAEVLLYRPGGVYPPTNPDDFEQEIAMLPTPMIADIVRELEPITSVRGFRVPELYRHHFEQMKRWPSGLLVMGDAFCIYDPIFGQGMTVAAIEAEVLEASLQEQSEAPRPHFEQRVLERMQQVIEPAWWLNCANDLQWDGVTYEADEPLQGIEFGQKYMALFLKLATSQRNWELYGLYWGVNTLSVSPEKMLNPQRAAAVLTATEEGRQLLTVLSERCELPVEEALQAALPVFTAATSPTEKRG
ncbi:NAD(P)/FAD-dependent oxidoreductase [Brevibacillus migulae]|uniref:NAD(P)/FAD-dependent oxidoreductase n=1 Tax=Brevibacillus migulae TaxID=1644114 RepID=UPI00106E13F8|nr:FAD dependent oxidoreductase [Brevibacillus migulae]